MRHMFVKHESQSRSMVEMAKRLATSGDPQQILSQASLPTWVSQKTSILMKNTRPTAEKCYANRPIPQEKITQLTKTIEAPQVATRLYTNQNSPAHTVPRVSSSISSQFAAPIVIHRNCYGTRSHMKVRRR